MQNIKTFLTFKKNADEATALYVSFFSKLPEDLHPDPAGGVNSVRFQLIGQEFTAVNGGNYFGKSHESISIYVSCEMQLDIEGLKKAYEGR